MLDGFIRIFRIFSSKVLVNSRICHDLHLSTFCWGGSPTGAPTPIPTTLPDVPIYLLSSEDTIQLASGKGRA
jgi:hypothetical protein